MFRPVEHRDAEDIARIYNHYVRFSTITFEEEEASVANVSHRISVSLDSDIPWLVCESEGRVTGYANAGVWKARSAYRFTVEVSIYLDQSVTGQGVGTQLYRALFDELRARSYHSAIGVIALPNPASITLHEKMGMKKVAHFKEVGYKFDKWIDVGYWQVILDAWSGRTSSKDSPLLSRVQSNRDGF